MKDLDKECDELHDQAQKAQELADKNAAELAKTDDLRD